MVYTARRGYVGRGLLTYVYNMADFKNVALPGRDADPRKAGRNAEIEFLRFAASVAVVLFHLHLIDAGLLAVDFFFILSGTLMARSMFFSLKSSKVGVEALTPFFFRKLRSFYPELLVAVLIGLVASLTKDDMCVFWHRCYCTLINEVCLLRMTGICTSPEMGSCPPSWYLSSMMIAVVVTYPIIRYVRNPILLFFSGCLILGCLVQHAGCMQTSHVDWYAVTYSSNIRAVGDFLLGASVCYAAEYLKVTELSVVVRRWLTVVKYVAVALLLLMFTVRYRPTEPSVVLLCSYVICCCFSGKSMAPHGERWNKLCCFLGKLSLPVFLAHWPLVRLLAKLEKISFLQDTYTLYPLLFLVLGALIAPVHLGGAWLRLVTARGK